MFESLNNTVVAEFILSAVGPVLVGSKGSNELDPTLPDAAFLMGSDGEQKAFVIPGSTIKGVIRSRYCDVNGNVPTEEVFGCINGQKTHRSKLYFHDAYADMKTVKCGIRYSTAIKSINQNAKKNSLNNMQAVEKGDFHAGFKAINCTDENIYALLKILDEVNFGLVKFGGRKSRGFGAMKISSFTLRENSGFDENFNEKEKIVYHSLEDALKAYSERVKK